MVVDKFDQIRVNEPFSAIVVALSDVFESVI